MRLVSLSLFLLFSTGLFANAPVATKHDDDDRCSIRGFVGITHDMPSNSKLRRMGLTEKGGAFINTIVGCTSAEKAGLQPMDYLVSVNGNTVSRDDPFFCLLSDVRVGETVSIGYYRQGQLEQTKLTLGERRDACHDVNPFPKRGFFGLNDGDTDGRPGVVVDVSSRGPSAMLGMRDGDRILAINGYPVNDWDDISTVKRLIKDENNVDFTIQRDGQDQLLSGPVGDIDDGSYNNNWTVYHGSNKDDCDDVIISGHSIRGAIQDALDEVDLDEIEREVEEAIAEIDFDEIERETENAIDIAMAAVREAFAEIREESDFPNRSDVDPSEMEARLEEVTEEDLRAMERRSIDMPKTSNLQLNNFTASPNPSDGRFRLGFELPTEGPTEIQIYSAAGREVYAYDLGVFRGSFDDELDVMRNGPGAYFLVVRQGNQAFTRKLVFVRN